VILVSDLPEREAVAPEMAAARVLRVEGGGVDPVHAVERSGEQVAGALDDEVIVVRHQADREGAELEAVDRLLELLEEAPPIGAVPEDSLPRNPAGRHMPDAVGGKRRARNPRHDFDGRRARPARGPMWSDRCGIV
jgi:hypothetical protein